MYRNKTYRVFNGLIWMLVLLMCCNFTSVPQEREYLIKAAFIEKITRFVQWPESETEREYITIGVVSDDEEVFETIKYYFQDQLIQDKYVEVKSLNGCEEGIAIDLLFITDDCEDEILEKFDKILNPDVLLISDNCQFNKSEIHINLINNDNSIGFEINPEKLIDEGFYVSSKLFAYGDIIK